MISVFVVNELNTNSNVCCKDYCKQHNINCARTYSAKVILASVTSSTVSVHYSRSLSTSFFWQNYDFHSLYTLHSWFFFETDFNEFTNVNIDKNVSPVKNNFFYELEHSIICHFFSSNTCECLKYHQLQLHHSQH